jgi:hypothetical protein
MSDSIPVLTAVKGTVAPDRMALLHTLVFTALRLCTAQLDDFASRLETTLGIQAENAASETDRELLRAAHERLRAHSATFQRLAGDFLQRTLMQAVQDTAEHAAGALEAGAMDLSLITFNAMERKVIIDNLSQAIDRAGAEPLAVLNLRIAHWLQTDDIRSSHNPFRSEVFLQAVSDAWGTFDPESGAHRLVLRQMMPEVFLQLVPVWKALNQELSLRHVLPDAELIYRRQEALANTVPPPSADEALRQWLAPQGTLNVNDARAAQLLDGMFARLSHNDTIPAGVRRLLASLQAGTTRAVLADPRFFFDARHPLRRALESCTEAGLGVEADGDGGRVLQALEGLCAKLVLAPPEQFDTLAGEFDALTEREDPPPRARLDEAISEATNEENVSQAERRAERDILARIEGGEVDEFIESFLRTHWLRVLAFAHGMQEAKPDVLRKVLAAMDDLIWSVKPKQSPEERKSLIERLPALLSMLNAWLNVVKWDGKEGEAFFSTLAERHALAMRGVDESSRRALEIRMDAVQRASEHQLSRRAQEQQEAEIAPYMQVVDGLKTGNWLEFVRNDGGKTNCKLLWISPARSRFIFAGRRGQLLFTLDRDALAQALRAARITLIPTGELVERALSDALRELGAT